MTEFVEVPGGRIAYDVTGSGPLVVLSHGIGVRPQDYRFLAPRLAQAGYRVASADLRGHGESSMGWASITRTDVAGDLLALAGHLGGPAVIAGHSISGGAATIAAATRPDPVAGIVEINPFTRKPRLDVGGLLRVRRYRRHARVPQPGHVAALPGPGLPGQARRLRRLHGGAGRQAARARPDGRVPEDLQVHARPTPRRSCPTSAARPWSSWARWTPTSPAPGPRAAGQGGGYEWRADGQPAGAGAAALELSPDGTITKLTVVWDGSLLEDRAITALAADAVDR